MGPLVAGTRAGERYGQRSIAYGRYEGTENAPGTEGTISTAEMMTIWEVDTKDLQPDSNLKAPTLRDSEDAFGLERVNVQGRRDEDFSAGQRQSMVTSIGMRSRRPNTDGKWGCGNLKKGGYVRVSLKK